MTTKAIARILLVLTVGVAASPLSARNLKVIKVGQPDASNIRSLVADVTAGCHTDREKTIALWGYITRNPYFWWWCSDLPEPNTELGYVLDPITRFNVHGGVICFEVQHSLATLLKQVGIRSRQLSLPGHCILEVWFDNDWHVFDAQVDCSSYFIGDDGQEILSHAEVCSNTSKYIINQAHPSDPFFKYNHFGGKFIPWETRQYVANNFYTGASGVYAALISWGHTVDFDLRRGEKLIRRWSRAGRWFCPKVMWDSIHKDGFANAALGPHEMRDPKQHYVNGELIYQPDWAANENNFTDGLYAGANYVLQTGKVGPAGPGDCYVIFRVQAPYHLVGKPGTLGLDGDSTDGCIIEGDFHRETISDTNTISVSTDNGLTWTTVWTNDATGDRHLKLDVTNQVEGHYGYLIKVQLLGDSVADANLSNLKLRNWLMMSPVPLPAIQPGTNHFKFSCKPRHAVFWVKADLSSSPAYQRFFTTVSGLNYSTSYASHLNVASGKGYAQTRVQPPAGWKIDWLTVVGSYGSRSTSDRVQVMYRTDVDPKWRFGWKGAFDGGAHWREEQTCDIFLRQPADYCDVMWRMKRVSGHMSLNLYRIYAHCSRPEPALQPGMVKVTHQWIADGRFRSHTVVPDLGGQAYTIQAKGTNIVNHALTMEVANEPAP